MRELPRKLTKPELEELFSGPSQLVDLLAEIDDPLERAEDVAQSIDDRDKAAALAQHPASASRRPSSGVATRR